jgi:hypothetical protein
MSARNRNGGLDWNARVTKDRAEIKKSKGSMFKNSFGDLPDGTIYRDPAGFKTGESVELQKDFWEALTSEPIPALGGKTVIEKWNELQRKGFSIADTTEEIQKSLDTGDWTLPLDILPEVFVINPEQTPMADLMTRMATQDDEIVATPVEDDIEPSFGLEDPNVGTDSDGNYVYSYDQPTYGDLSYDVVGLGAATRISDQMILASANLRNASATQEQSLVRGMRKKMERQIIHGTDAAEGGDANGWEGLNDIGSVVSDLGDPSSLSDADIEDYTRELIDEVEYQGAPRGDIAIVCGFEWHRRLRESLVDNVRYDAGDEMAGAFTTLEFDDVPVYKSHAFTRLSDLGSSTTAAPIYAVNMNATYLGMLQESSLEPLARLGPQERVSISSYGTLVSEAPSHIQSYTVTTPA